MNVILYSLVPFIIDTFRIIVGDVNITPTIKYGDTLINDAIDYIKENISVSLTVTEVAEYLHLSPKQFYRLFTKIVGISPGNYIRDYRTEKMRNMLAIQDLSVESVANIMGYSDSSAMIKAFKKKTKRSPKQFKKLFPSDS